MRRVFKNALTDGVRTDIVCADGVILSVGQTDEPGEDLGGAPVFPGLVDIHTHGANGFDVMEGGLWEIARFELRRGITAFVPTTMTAEPAALRAATANLPRLPEGADALGFHLEGPYLAKEYCGAQNAAFLRNPDPAELTRLPHIRLLTLAPELPGALDCIRDSAYPVFLGHTACDYDTAKAAFAAGAAGLTHTFNAMTPFHHREPGPVGAAFDCNAYVQVISDGLHLHPATVRLLYRLFGPQRMILISDSMRATGLGDGTYCFGGQPVTVTNGVARTESGALAGSTSTLYDCVLSAIGMGIPAADAFRMASGTPAALLHEKRGEIRPGYRADLLVTDEQYRLQRVIRA